MINSLKNILSFLLLSLLFLQYSIALKGQIPFKYPQNSNTYFAKDQALQQDLNEKLEYSEEDTDLEELVATDNFLPYHYQTISQIDFGKPTWFKIAIFNSLATAKTWVFHIGKAESLSMVLVYEDGKNQEQEFNSQSLPPNSCLLEIPADKAVNIYFRCIPTQLNLQLETTSHWEMRNKAENAQTNLFFFSIGLGILLILLAITYGSSR